MSDRFDSASDERTANNVMRHEYRRLTDAEKADMQAIKDGGQDMLDRIDTAAGHSGDCRELSLARTKVEEAVMWAVKAVTK